MVEGMKSTGGKNKQTKKKQKEPNTWINSDQMLTTQGFPCSSAGKESACNAGDPGLIPGSGRSPGEGLDDPLQYSGLENSMDYTVHGSQRMGQDSHFHFLSFYKDNVISADESNHF